MASLKFYHCRICGNLVVMINDSTAVPHCCGQPMTQVSFNTNDTADVEKHLPMIFHKGTEVLVTVGQAPHPMVPDHSIAWIILQTDIGAYAKTLAPGDPAKACFQLCETEKVKAAYALCTLHGLWVKEHT